ncbi:MAG TPA: hypothetical protein VES67_23540 [Vicinamibacterales bacterium]|nr:hypothetical protein [Vicinamibacterales bacterium]
MTRTFQFLLLTVLAAQALVIGQGPDAAKVLADVRAALGGDAKLEAVKSVAVEGRLTKTTGGQTLTNDFEMAFELPDRFVKKEVIAVLGQTSITRTTGFNGDGLIEVVDTPPQMGGGMVITRMAGSGPPGMQATPEQIATQRQAILASNKREFARLLLGMFAANPRAFPLEFAYAGEAEAPDGQAHVIDVKGADGFTARLFVDTKTRLPLMLSWMDKEPMRMTIGGGAAVGSGAITIAHGAHLSGGARQVTPEQAEQLRHEMEQKMKEAEANRRTVEYRLIYGDYKAFSGVQMPTRIQRMIDGQATEELSLEKIKVNTKIDPRKFEVTK